LILLFISLFFSHFRSQSQSTTNEIKVVFYITSLLFIPSNKSKDKDRICFGSNNGEIHLYKMDENMKLTLFQEFPKEHKDDCRINSLLVLNQTTLVSCAWSSDIEIVVWFKSKYSSSFKPRQRITKRETGDDYAGVSELVSLNGEEFASLSSPFYYYFVLIWTKDKSKKEEEEFLKKQKIDLGFYYDSFFSMLFISITNELIFCEESIKIYSSSSSTLFEKKQEINDYSSSNEVYRLVELNSTYNKKEKTFEFASGHKNGQIKIWSKEILNSDYSLLRTLQSFNSDVWGLWFISDLNVLIACSFGEDKIVIYKNKGEEEEEKEVLEHQRIRSLIHLRNGVFVSVGGSDRCLRLWEPCIY